MPTPTPRSPRRRQKAGASAQRMADRIRAQEIRAQTRRARWILPPTAAATGAAGWALATATHLWPAGLAVALAPLLAVVARLYRSSGSNWQVGADGEKRTGRILDPLQRYSLGRWAVLHDRKIPNSRANLDHVIIGPKGVWYVDTKAWSHRSRVTLGRNGELWYGKYPQQQTLRTVAWEAERAAQALGQPVRAIIAVHGARVAPGGLYVQGVVVLAAGELRDYLRLLPSEDGWGRRRVRALRRRAEATLVPYED